MGFYRISVELRLQSKGNVMGFSLNYNILLTTVQFGCLLKAGVECILLPQKNVGKMNSMI